MRDAECLAQGLVPSSFSGKTNHPLPFPQVISGSLWKQPMQAKAVGLQTGAPGGVGGRLRNELADEDVRGHRPVSGLPRRACGCRARVPACACKHMHGPPLHCSGSESAHMEGISSLGAGNVIVLKQTRDDRN